MDKEGHRQIPINQAFTKENILPEAVIPNPKLKLMDQVREVLRLKHYSIRTERCYCDWIRRYIRFHKMRSREDLAPGKAKIELFLSDLAVNGHVAASTQNQAFNGLLFLYSQVLHQQLSGIRAGVAGWERAALTRRAMMAELLARLWHGFVTGWASKKPVFTGLGTVSRVHGGTYTPPRSPPQRPPSTV